MRTNTLKIAALLAVASIYAAPAVAADAPVAAQATVHYSTADSDIGTLMDNPATKAVLEKYLPEISKSEQIDMARSMTLKQVQGFAPDKITDAALAKVDADLASIPVKK